MTSVTFCNLSRMHPSSLVKDTMVALSPTQGRSEESVRCLERMLCPVTGMEWRLGGGPSLPRHSHLFLVHGVVFSSPPSRLWHVLHDLSVLGPQELAKELSSTQWLSLSYRQLYHRVNPAISRNTSAVVNHGRAPQLVTWAQRVWQRDGLFMGRKQMWKERDGTSFSRIGGIKFPYLL